MERERERNNRRFYKRNEGLERKGVDIRGRKAEGRESCSYSNEQCLKQQKRESWRCGQLNVREQTHAKLTKDSEITGNKSQWPITRAQPCFQERGSGTKSGVDGTLEG